MRRIMIFCLAISLALCGCSPKKKSMDPEAKAAALEPFDSHYALFKTSLERKEHSQALAALRSSLESFWDRSPLLLENIKFVKGADNSYGIYDPRDEDAFAEGEPVYLYMEPVGYGVTKNPAGYYEFGFTADFQLEDEGGKILGGQNNFANMAFKSWNFNTEISLTFTYTLSGLEKGKYRIITHVQDRVSDKKATADKWFTVQ